MDTLEKMLFCYSLVCRPLDVRKIWFPITQYCVIRFSWMFETSFGISKLKCDQILGTIQVPVMMLHKRKSNLFLSKYYKNHFQYF